MTDRETASKQVKAMAEAWKASLQPLANLKKIADEIDAHADAIKNEKQFGPAGGQMPTDAVDYKSVAEFLRLGDVEAAYQAWSNLDTASRDGFPESFLQFLNDLGYIDYEKSSKQKAADDDISSIIVNGHKYLLKVCLDAVKEERIEIMDIHGNMIGFATDISEAKKAIQEYQKDFPNCASKQKAAKDATNSIYDAVMAGLSDDAIVSQVHADGWTLMSRDEILRLANKFKEFEKHKDDTASKQKAEVEPSDSAYVLEVYKGREITYAKNNDGSVYWAIHADRFPKDGMIGAAMFFDDAIDFETAKIAAHKKVDSMPAKQTAAKVSDAEIKKFITNWYKQNEDSAVIVPLNINDTIKYVIKNFNLDIDSEYERISDLVRDVAKDMNWKTVRSKPKATKQKAQRYGDVEDECKNLKAEGKTKDEIWKIIMREHPYFSSVDLSGILTELFRGGQLSDENDLSIYMSAVKAWIESGCDSFEIVDKLTANSVSDDVIEKILIEARDKLGLKILERKSDGTVIEMPKASKQVAVNTYAKERMQTIELDCPPGYPRPGDLIEDVIAGTGLPTRETVGRVFGNWIWDYSDIDSAIWEKAKPILEKRITELYNSGKIRFGSW